MYVAVGLFFWEWRYVAKYVCSKRCLFFGEIYGMYEKHMGCIYVCMYVARGVSFSGNLMGCMYVIGHQPTGDL